MKKHRLIKSLLFAPLLALVATPILLIAEPNNIVAEADTKTTLERATERAEKSSKTEKVSNKTLSTLSSVQSTELNPSLSVECTSGGNCPSTSTNRSEQLDVTIHRNGNTTVADGKEWYLIPLVSNESDFYLRTSSVPETHSEMYSPSLLKRTFSSDFSVDSLTTFSFTSESSVDVSVDVELYNYGNNYIAFYISDDPNSPEYEGLAGTVGSQVSIGPDYNNGPYNATDNIFIHTIDNQDHKDRFEFINMGYGTIKDESPAIAERTLCTTQDIYCEYVADEHLTNRTFTYSPEPGHTFDLWSSGGYYTESENADTETSTTYTLTTSESPLLVLAETVLYTKPVYRFWSDQNDMHFYTISQYEKNYIINNYTDYQWKYERVSYYAAPLLSNGSCPVATTPLYRFWSDQNDGHFYTISEYEKNYVIIFYTDYQWKYERVAYCVGSSYSTNLQDEVYRFWSDQNHGHFYTSSEYEKDYVIDNYTDRQWRYERVAFYVSNSSTQ